MTTSDELRLFPSPKISALKQRAFTKSATSTTQYINCLVRQKAVRLTREETVRQLWIEHLEEAYGYPLSRMRVEYPVVMGSTAKNRADIVIMDDDEINTPYIVFEVKKPDVRGGKAQLRSYTNATGAPLAAWSNGASLNIWNRRDPNYFVQLPSLPRSDQTIVDVTSDEWDISRLEELHAERQAAGENLGSLRSLIVEMEDEVLANAGVDVFEEVFKLIFTKLYDEVLSTWDVSRPLQFRNSNTAHQLSKRIHQLFSDANRKWPGVFQDENINLEPAHLQVCIGTMETWKLFNSNLDIIDNAFEYLVNKSSKGEKGQFFTPRWVVDMCVKMLDPRAHESMIDTACGSTGFAIHTIFHVWQRIMQEKAPDKTLLTAEQKPAECTDYVRDHVFGIDFDEKCVRAARCLNLIAGDGESNVLHLNTLDYGKWQRNTQRDEWVDVYATGWSRLRKRRAGNDYSRFNFEVLMTNPPFAGSVSQADVLARYNVAIQNGKVKKQVERDALFLERNIDFLAPGGRMAIVLPLGRFNNATSSHLRKYAMDRCRVLAVVSLDGHTFMPHTATKTAVLFLQKWNDDEDADSYCPQVEDYNIFVAEQRKRCTTSTGDRIVVVDDEGRPVRDTHGHYLIDHDLFNQAGVTGDGIAEAFQAFAYREGLSFSGAPTSDSHVVLNAGTVVKAESFRKSNRWDPKFYRPEYLKLIRNVQLAAPKTVTIEDIAQHNGRGVQPVYDEDGEVPLISSTKHTGGLARLRWPQEGKP